MKSLGFHCWTGRATLTCHGPIRPAEFTETYDVEITLHAGDRPRARVLNPPLQTREDGEPIPHTWGPDEPCFYYPKERDWTPSMAMSRSIVPWLALWLLHYEGWLATGIWEGGGVEH